MRETQAPDLGDCWEMRTLELDEVNDFSKITLLGSSEVSNQSPLSFKVISHLLTSFPHSWPSRHCAPTPLEQTLDRDGDNNSSHPSTSLCDVTSHQEEPLNLGLAT